MGVFFVILLLAGAVYADESSEFWSPGKRYVYNITSRTVAASNQKSGHFAGVTIEGQLELHREAGDLVRGRLHGMRHSSLQTDHDYRADIPEDLLDFQRLHLSREPFAFRLHHGLVRELTVDAATATWEVNLVKSVLGQFQVDVRAANSGKPGQAALGFEAMEDSVGGKCRVAYETLPFQRERHADVVPLARFGDVDNVLVVSKRKNYSDCEERPDFYYGADGKNDWQYGGRDNPKKLKRTSISAIEMTKESDHFLVQYALTISKNILASESDLEEKGLIAGLTSVKLTSIEDLDVHLPAPSNPKAAGNLVYSVNSPSDSSALPHYNEYYVTQESRVLANPRNRRKIFRRGKSRYSSEESSEVDSDESKENSFSYQEEKLDEAPRLPMMAYFVGLHGNSLQSDDKIDVVKSAAHLATEIAKDLESPNAVDPHQMLEKFAIVVDLVRTMSLRQIERLFNHVAVNKPDEESYARVVVRDAIAEAGTGPALLHVKKRIESGELKAMKAKRVLSRLAKTLIGPSDEYIRVYFEMLKTPQVESDPHVLSVATLSFCDLARRAMVNKRNAYNRYSAYANLGQGPIEDKRQDVPDKYIPYFEDKLKSAIASRDSSKINLYVTALGEFGHPRILSTLEPYLEGEKPVTPFQRLQMVVALGHLAENYPEVARSVLYKIYANTEDHYEIRTAAVYLLMRTNPPADMLQRMAEFTRQDNSKQVNSAVKSTIESLAEMEHEDFRELSDAAKSARPLLTSEEFGSQYSKAIFKVHESAGARKEYSIEAHYIGSDDSIIPKGFYFSISTVKGGVGSEGIQVGAMVSSIQDILNFDVRSMKRPEKQKFSPQTIAKVLSIVNRPRGTEGVVFFNSPSGFDFYSLDNNTIQMFSDEFAAVLEALDKGEECKSTMFGMVESVLTFPTETGFPLTVSYQQLALLNVHQDARMTTNNPQNTVEYSTEMGLLASTRVQKRIGFVAPFESSQYLVGNDDAVQLHLPARLNVLVGSNDVSLRVRPHPDHPQYDLLHLRKEPFVSRHHVRHLKPVSADHGYHVIGKDRVNPAHEVWGDRTSKLRLEWHVDSAASHRRGGLASAARKAVHSGILGPEYVKMSLKVFAAEDLQLEFRYGHTTVKPESPVASTRVEGSLAPLPRKGLADAERRQEFLNSVRHGIRHATADFVELGLRLNNETEPRFEATAAWASSNADDRVRAVAQLKVQNGEGKTIVASLGLNGTNPKEEVMDWQETMRAVDTPVELDIEGRADKFGNDAGDDAWGRWGPSATRVGVHLKLTQTDEMKAQIRASKYAKECLKETKNTGNKLSASCRKANELANNYNKLDFKFNVDPMLEGLINRAIQYLESRVKLNTSRPAFGSGLEGTLEFHTLKKMFMDVSVRSPKGEVFEQIDFTPEMVNWSVLQPGGEAADPMEVLLKDNERYRKMTQENVGTCFLDMTQLVSFDEEVIPMKLGNCWHVLMTYVPKVDPDSSNGKSWVPEDGELSVLARETGGDHKVMKVVMGQTEVELARDNGTSKIHARVNGKAIVYSRNNSFFEWGKHISLEIIELPDKSVQLISEKYQVKIVFDGYRAAISLGNDFYHKSILGLCGDWDGESANDLKTPQNCLLKNSEEFTASWALIEPACEGPSRRNIKKMEKSACIEEHLVRGDYISNGDIGRSI